MDTILVVDDEKNYLLVMDTLLSEEGYQVVTAESGLRALEMVGAGLDPDLVLTDMTMPKMDGMELLARLRADRMDLPIIMMTAYGTVEKAVEAMRKGAHDYITKPFKNEDLLRSIRKALEMGRLLKENRELARALKERYSFGNIIGKSKPMLEIYRLIEKVADSRATILVTGESGTGKELIAKAIHYQSPRNKGPFVAVNCAALAESLLESELFGHEKGAFTDAKAQRKGRFELAHGGSLFLDEIGEMALSLQVKFLRVLQERRFERVGGTQSLDVDVRLITATNRDLKKEVAAGRFREDLYYRLKVVDIHLPALRERLDDLPLLVAHFIKKYTEESGGKSVSSVSPEAWRRLYAYPWPGNVRELENTVERAVILSKGPTISPEDLPEELQEPSPENGRTPGPPQAPVSPDPSPEIPPGFNLAATLEAKEKDLILQALSQANNVQSRAADLLGIKKNLMQYKMKKYGLL